MKEQVVFSSRKGCSCGWGAGGAGEWLDPLHLQGLVEVDLCGLRGLGDPQVPHTPSERGTTTQANLLHSLCGTQTHTHTHTHARTHTDKNEEERKATGQ